MAKKIETGPALAAIALVNWMKNVHAVMRLALPAIGVNGLLGPPAITLVEMGPNIGCERALEERMVMLDVQDFMTNRAHAI